MCEEDLQYPLPFNLRIPAGMPYGGMPETDPNGERNNSENPFTTSGKAGLQARNACIQLMRCRTLRMYAKKERGTMVFSNSTGRRPAERPLGRRSIPHVPNLRGEIGHCGGFVRVDTIQASPLGRVTGKISRGDGGKVIQGVPGKPWFRWSHESRCSRCKK